MTNFFEIALGKRTRSRQSSYSSPTAHPTTIQNNATTPLLSKKSSFAAGVATSYTTLSSSSYGGGTAAFAFSSSMDEHEADDDGELLQQEEQEQEQEHRDDAESMARETVESIAEEYYHYNLQQQRALRLQQEKQKRQRYFTKSNTNGNGLSMAASASTISALSTTSSATSAEQQPSSSTTMSTITTTITTKATTELIVLWDCTSVPFSTNHAASLLTKSLGRKYGNVMHRRLYYCTADNCSSNGNNTRSDALCGFDIVQTPTQLLDNNKQNNAITWMLVDMSSFVWDSACRGQRACVVVVTSNAEFAYGLARLRDRGIMIIVVFLNEDEICRELQGVADVCLLLEREYGVAMPSSANNKNKNKNNYGGMNHRHYHRKPNHHDSIDMCRITTTPPRYPKSFRKSSSSFSLCRKKHENIKMISQSQQPTVTVNDGISDIQLICCCVHILQKARTKKMGGHGMSRAKETTVMKLFAAQTHDDSQVRYRANRNLAILDGYIHLGFIDQSIARDHVIVIEQPW
eukprot:CAMPEP_0196809554 /NCGR_PEP_ID=MMETSP1362-20130617/9473_1 /TAXON_ID=163516 /ORGANISM="Leptocylindrus danicus, Strain CCMP1856" /LENGTH=518 /DNA_ID=CAMNT_0042184279 /DNA_START=398 /DNA_END=1951 /DNA_ORIENTATION=+